MASLATLQRRMDELAVQAGISGQSEAQVRRIMKQHRQAYSQLMAASRVDVIDSGGNVVTTLENTDAESAVRSAVAASEAACAGAQAHE